MSTTTIYSDAYMIVVEHPRDIETAPWLDEVTYLIDANGQTTGLLEQTEKPTSGVSLEPVPFTPVQAAVINSAAITSPPSAASTQTPDDVSSSPRSTSLSTTVTTALAVLGTVLVLILVGVTWYLLRQRHKKAQVRIDKSKLRSADNFWQSSPIDDVSASPPQSLLEPDEKKEPISMPRSILKPTKALDTKGWRGTVQTVFKRTDDEGNKPNMVEKRDASKKKGVTFGEDQVRVFGRTPLPSRTASLLSRNTEE